MKLFICFVFLISLHGCVSSDDDADSDETVVADNKSKDLDDSKRVWTVCKEFAVGHVQFV